MPERPDILDPGLAGRDARPVPGVDNGFAAAYRVRFDEAGPDGLMRTSTLLRYAQDIAWRHSEAMGFDRAWYAERGLGWVVRGVDMAVLAPIPLGHTLRLATAVVGHRRIWARRLCSAQLTDGTPAARVATDWVLIDGRGRIVRIPEDFGVAFTNPEIHAEIVRVPAPDGRPTARLSLDVRPRDIDPMRHVNNAVYLDWAEEALLAAGWDGPLGPGSRCRIEYAAAAEPRDRVSVDVFGEAARWEVRIARSDGTDLARVAGESGGAGPTT